MSRYLWVFKSDETEPTTGPVQWVSDNLGLLYLTPFLEVAREILVAQLIIQPSDKYLLLDTTNRLTLLILLALPIRPGRPIS